MAKRFWILIGIVAVLVVLVLRYFTAGHQTPPGQPQLLTITPRSLPEFAEEFNRYPNAQRVVLLLSPTCPVCLEGALSVEQVLHRHLGNDIRVFAVWEPMLPTDWGQPTTYVLARLSDSRVIQVWDGNHLIAALIEKGAAGRRPACCNRNGNWWDLIATYPPASKWTNSAPSPKLLGGTIVSNAPELEAQLERGL